MISDVSPYLYLIKKKKSMSKMSKIMLGIWAVLAIVSFICAFFCPLFPKIIGIAFGVLNLSVILTLVITYFQGLYWKNKLNGDVQLQEDEAETTA